MAEPALKTFTDRVLRRPAVLDATRLCGITDSEVARLLNVSPMAVSYWASGKHPIPRVKHHALILFVYALARIFHGGDMIQPPATAHTMRARLLFGAIHQLLELARQDAGDEPPPESEDDELWGDDDLAWAWYSEEAEVLANEMLARLASWFEK